MKSFDQTHLILLVVTVAFVAATMWLASKLPRKGQTWLFAAGALVCTGGIFWRYAMSMSFSPPNSHLSWETLAIQMLQVCSFNLILVILMLVPRLELARQYSFFFSMFAAATALVSLPKSWEALDWYAPTILNSWLNHVFAIALPLWMLAARRLKPQKKYILPVAGCVVGYFVIVYGCTEWLHAVGRLPEEKTFSFVYDPGGVALLEWLHKLIPIPLLYLVPLIPAMVGFFWLLTWLFRNYKVHRYDAGKSSKRNTF